MFKTSGLEVAWNYPALSTKETTTTLGIRSLIFWEWFHMGPKYLSFRFGDYTPRFSSSFDNRWARIPRGDHYTTNPNNDNNALVDDFSPTHLKNTLLGFTLTPLTVNKMVCLYFYHPGGAPWFSRFFVFLFGAISGAFLCVPACFFWCGFPVFFVVLFLVSFGDFAGGIFCAFPGAFSTVFWCFFPCIFSCLSLFFSIYMFPLGGGPVFCRAFFGGVWVLFPCFFSCFFSVFFLCLLSCFFSCILSFFLVLIFVLFFSCLGRHPRQATTIFCILARAFFGAVSGGHYTSEDRIYTIHCPDIFTYIYLHHLTFGYLFLFPRFLPEATKLNTSVVARWEPTDLVSVPGLCKNNQHLHNQEYVFPRQGCNFILKQ